ncbi:isopenicillin N-epimerase [Chondromyces crocatus]|uniref:Isopenicillin N-epimerase n=1 Tax=Chondromyces crocatus TaxID=52 RepID=A0A0K1E617_CHOCO|nr:isopenicillin N-epimerase [Chondromyces crocatus]
MLDPAIAFLNHGSFGACPRPVLDAQSRFREQMEREPVRFFTRELEPLLDGVLSALAAFLGADPEELALVPNATAGVNTVLRSLELGPGDELLTTDHAYNACRNALDDAARRAGARVVVAPVPFPVKTADEVIEAVLRATSPRTRFALIDHVTSPTGLVLPVAPVVAALSRRGVEVLVDGAHAPGMVPLDVHALGAAYYTGNCHKWMCAPKGAAFLHVERSRRHRIRPLVISHGANATRQDRSRFRLEFDWTGTFDPTPFLCIPEAIRFMASLGPGGGGWSALMKHNRAMAMAARAIMATKLGCALPCPEEMLGALAALPLPPRRDAVEEGALIDPLQTALLETYGVEVPIVPWPAPSGRLVRISAQIYNQQQEYERLIDALERLLRGAGSSESVRSQ